MKILLSPETPAAAGAPPLVVPPVTAVLSPSQVVALAGDLVDNVTKLTAIAKANQKALSAHNHAKGAPRVNPGPLAVVYGSLLTVAEQLQKHIAENTPKP